MEEQPIKRKRGRPRKVKLPEEIQTLVQETQEKTAKKESIKHEIVKQSSNWDVSINDSVEYFDINLSYELTGYRPITKNKGLDFNPDWFTETRETFLKTGKYCQFRPNTKAYSEFWDEQYRRCRDGMTVNGYTITGDNYFFLNFFQLMDLDNTEKAGGGRMYIFPAFYAGQYEMFHYIELCRRLRLNACIMKSREIGYSECISAILANSYNSIRNTVNLLTAFNSDYLNTTLSKVWNCLSFINDNTEGGFFKLRQVIDRQDHKKASVLKVVEGQKVESGWMSQIIGITADKPSKIRGYRSDLLVMEEAGSWPGLTKAYIQSTALVGQKGAQWGLRIVGGTSGDTGPALEGLRDMCYNPKTYAILPFRHKYNSLGEECLTSFFVPCTKIMKDRKRFLSHRGYVNEEAAKKFYNEARSGMTNSPNALIQYCAEFPFTLDESFSLEGENKFNKVHITEQLTKIRALKQCPPIETGYIEYMYKNQQHIPSNITGYKWIPNKNGKVKILEHPLWELPSIENANSITPREKMRGLYVIGIDGIDIGAAQTSTATKDPSDFCLVVMKRAYGINGPQVVAIYKDRPQVLNEAYKTAIKLAQYYNAVINIEATRLSFASWARDHGYLSYFMKRPRATLSDIARGKSNQIGTPATSAIIAHQTDLIADLVNDHYETMWFEEMLDELNRYTDENKRKFDIVAALGMACLADEELAGVVPKSTEVKQDKWQDIGYYTDSNGIKRYGVIPQKQNTNIQITWDNHYEDSRVRTSNPIVANGYI